MHDQFPRLAELGVPHRQTSGFQVDLAAVDRDGLTDPHAGHGE